MLSKIDGNGQKRSKRYERANNLAFWDISESRFVAPAMVDAVQETLFWTVVRITARKEMVCMKLEAVVLYPSKRDGVDRLQAGSFM